MGSENLKRVNNYAIMRLQSKLNAPFNNGVVHMRTLNNETLYKIEKYIKEYQIEKGKSPSYRNIMHFMNMSSLNLVQRYVFFFFLDGKIQRTRLGNIQIPSQLNKGETTIAPLLGAIACGEPSFAVEHIEDTFELPRSLFGFGKLFVLHAKGDSMIDAGISNGDLIVLRRQDYAEDGDIVVALTNGNNTLKRLFHKDGKIVLHPENKTMKDIIVNNCEIQGVLVGCIKTY